MALETGNGTGAPAFLPVGLPGVYGWRGTIGARTDCNGQSVPEKGPIPDLDRIAWLNRKVTILFDTNAATNPKVQFARRDLARELGRRGGIVYIADLPQAVGVNGCDDYLHTFGVEKLGEVLQRAVRYEWRQELILTDKGKIKPVLANAITALRSAPEWMGTLTFDEFSLRTCATKPTPWNHTGTWDEQSDRLLTDWLQHHGIMVAVSVASDAAETVAHDRAFHPVRDYLDSLKWDGRTRIDNWLSTYLKAEPPERDDSKSDADETARDSAMRHSKGHRTARPRTIDGRQIHYLCTVRRFPRQRESIYNSRDVEVAPRLDFVTGSLAKTRARNWRGSINYHVLIANHKK
jgi:hypothetical protein